MMMYGLGIFLMFGGGDQMPLRRVRVDFIDKPFGVEFGDKTKVRFTDEELGFHDKEVEFEDEEVEIEDE
ncbi:hypothetical protein LCGC14_2574320, partial [marine sediment metagenome]